MARKKYNTDEEAEMAIECIIIKANALDLAQEQIDNYVYEIDFICEQHKFKKEKKNLYKEEAKKPKS